MTPSVAEERALALHRPGAWRRLSIVPQAVLFILAIGGISAFYWFCELLQFPKGWVTAIASIVLAEVLIRREHFWRTGVESALWIGGLVAFIVALPSSGKPEAILLFVVAAAIAGWRMRNALFETLALVLLAVYIIVKEQLWLATAFALAVSIAALIAEMRLWKRPSTEFLWEAALIVMPVVGYMSIKGDTAKGVRVIALFGVLAIIFLAVGIRFRMRVVLLASVIAAAITAIEARDQIPLSDEMCLIVAGAIVLAAAAGLMRALRGRESGFVLADEPHELDEVLQIAAALPLAAPAASPAQPTPTGGGEFGGAGASGQF